MEAKNNYHTGKNAVVSYVSHQRNVVESTERSMISHDLAVPDESQGRQRASSTILCMWKGSRRV